MAKRAERRYHKQRMKNKARRLYPDTDKAEHYADYLTVCSCMMCCNPRRYGEITLQERRFYEKDKTTTERGKESSKLGGVCLRQAET